MEDICLRTPRFLETMTSVLRDLGCFALAAAQDTSHNQGAGKWVFGRTYVFPKMPSYFAHRRHDGFAHPPKMPAPGEDIGCFCFFYYLAGVSLFEVGVIRWTPAGYDLLSSVIEEFFKGASDEEAGTRLEAILSGNYPYMVFRIEGGIVHLSLAGTYQFLDVTHIIAQPIVLKLLQFEEIQHVPIYYAEGTSE